MKICLRCTHSNQTNYIGSSYYYHIELISTCKYYTCSLHFMAEWKWILPCSYLKTNKKYTCTLWFTWQYRLHFWRRKNSRNSQHDWTQSLGVVTFSKGYFPHVMTYKLINTSVFMGWRQDIIIQRTIWITNLIELRVNECISNLFIVEVLCRSAHSAEQNISEWFLSMHFLWREPCRPSACQHLRGVATGRGLGTCPPPPTKNYD